MVLGPNPIQRHPGLGSTQSDLIAWSPSPFFFCGFAISKNRFTTAYPENPERLWVRDSFSPVMKWLLLAGTCLWVGLISLFPLVDFLIHFALESIHRGHISGSASRKHQSHDGSLHCQLQSIPWMVHETCVHHPLGLDPTPASREHPQCHGSKSHSKMGYLPGDMGPDRCLAALTLRYGILGWAGSRLTHQQLDRSIKDLSLWK